MCAVNAFEMSDLIKKISSSNVALRHNRKIQRYERDANRLAKQVVAHWKRYVRRKKQGNPMVPAAPPPEPAMVSVVEQVLEEHEEATETTGLLV